MARYLKQASPLRGENAQISGLESKIVLTFISETACAVAGNVHFLNCNESTIGNVRFLGATMWTDFRLFGDGDRQIAMREAEALI